jgi:glycine hydroxymethyltransferase
MEKLCYFACITLNKNSVVGDVSVLTPGGVRIGAPALTTRGMVESDFEKIADFLDRLVNVGLRLQEAAGSKKLVDFVKVCAELEQVKRDVQEFARSFPMPGVGFDKMKYI